LVELIEARSTQMSKLSAMLELVAIRKTKIKAAIGAEQEAAIKIGTQVAALLQARWWSNYTKRAGEIELN
jgi:hypothetical protein